MCANRLACAVIVLISASNVLSHLTTKNEEFSYEEATNKSSLVFVFDTTGSMYNDLKQLREGAEMILKTALEDSDVIEDFVFVPFHDPAVGPATVTKDKEVFKSVLNKVRVYGGGDCPEKSLGGIQLALRSSRPRSFVYVFTDATAADHRLVGTVLDSVQRKQSQVVFVLTGHCNDLHRPNYKVYQQIAAASSGQIFNLNKTSVHKVLEFVKNSIRGRMVNLGSAVNPPGYNYSQAIPIDSTLGEVTVSVSGDKPSIRVVNPSGEELTGPPKLVTTLDLSEIMVVKVLNPEPGNWTITTGSAADHSVKVMGMSNLTFNHGFSVEPPASMAETSYRPLQGTYNHMMISLTQTDRPVDIRYAEILSMAGKTLFELPLREFDKQRKIYIANAFVPPDEFFYISINGQDEYKQELRRVGATAVQSKPPDVPFLTVPRKVEARVNDRIVLKCNVESLVPVTAMWTKDALKIQPQISSLQSTVVEYVIEDMREESVGLYRCVANNVAGITKAATEVTMTVDPPQVTISPENKTIEMGDNATITCTVVSDALLTNYQLVFNGTQDNYTVDVHLEPNIEGLYVFNKTLQNASEKESGTYSCVVSNRGGRANHTTRLTVQAHPTSQILGPHSLTALQHTDMQLVCHVEYAQRVLWKAPNGSVVREVEINGVFTDMFDVRNVTDDAVWTCVAVRGSRNVSDSVEISVLVKPEVEIEGLDNITIVNGTSVDITCSIVARPEPRILWHKETERFLNNTITLPAPNVYKSVLTLDSTKEDVNGTYFCFGENSEGIHQDSVTVSVIRKMKLVEGFADISVQLYSQVHLPCKVDAYPPPNVQWYHNNTDLQLTENAYLLENNNTLHFLKVDFDNLGSYYCKADNGYESLRVEGSLRVVGLETPVISKTQREMITRKGKSALIPCRVTNGNPPPVLTWQYKSNVSDSFTTLPDNIIMNPDSTELVILKVDNIHGGVYKCTAQNILGMDDLNISLIVQYPPQIIQDTKYNDGPLIVESGNPIQLSCKATGLPPPVVTWRKDYQPISYSNNVYLTDSNDLVIERATEYDSALYTCNVTSALGGAQRNFTVLVYELPVITVPGIEPELEVLEGDVVELPCTARGVPRPQIEWLLNGEPIIEERKRVDGYGLRFIANLTDFGEYSCIARNEYGNSSVDFSVYVWVPPHIEPPLEMSKEVLVGASTGIGCDAVSFPIPSIVWEFNGKLLQENTTYLSFNEFGSLNITNATIDHEGVYTCVAENVAGIAKKNIYLNLIEPPKILEDNYTGPYIATNQDSVLVLSCRAAGRPQPIVVWGKDGRYLGKDSRYEVDIEGTLIIKSPSEDMSGEYTCTAKNALGAVNKTVTVEIYPILPSRMLADESQSTITVLEGTNASIECPIHVADENKVKWYKDAILLSTGILIIPNITRLNASTYACVATTTIGSSYTNVQVVVEWAPTFVGKGGDMEVLRDEDVYFGCENDAKPVAKTKWLFNSKPILGEDEDRLKILNVRKRHVGIYKCIVTNDHGTITRQFTLDVLEPPFISEFDLLDVQLKEGTNATLECKARGFPEPNITWTFKNKNWLIGNSSLSTSNINSESEGLYRCDAASKAGATYIVYRVTVALPAKVGEVMLFRQWSEGGETVQGGVNVTLDSNVRLSCAASGKPTPSIQWIRNGEMVSQNSEDISYADLVLNRVETSHSGVYICIASNDGGTEDRKIRLDVLEPPKIFKDIFQTSNTSDNVTRVEVISGQAFYLHCHPNGNPMPEIYWFKDDLPFRLFDDTMTSKDYGEVLVSHAAKLEQSGNYTCVARSAVGNASVIYLVDVLVPPPISKESIRPISTRVGTQLVVRCPVEGSPLPHVMWIKHPYSEISAETPRVTLTDDNYTLIINQTEILDSGKYSCIMTNKVGTTEVVFDVTIEKKPSIAGNTGANVAESHVVPLRRSVVLKCGADGHPAPKISWLKDTQQLSDNLSNIQRVLGNSLLAVWSAGTGDGGQYICVAENSAGTAYRRFNVMVQVPGKWSPWSEWSLCNATCGLGHQHRARRCHYTDDYNVTYDISTKSDKIILDESSCKGPARDRRKCHMPACEADSESRWSAWAAWSPCSAPCGAGSQARTRRCRARGHCVGDNVQIRKCPNLPECTFDTNPSRSDNEVYGSIEDKSSEVSAFIPEATFEMQPELVNTQYATDVEEVYIRPDSNYSSIYYEVNVTDNLDRSYRGSCGAGYRHNNSTGSCDDIDECLIEKNMCHSTQICENTVGAYRCACTEGFVALGVGQRCLDINECEQDTHGCQFACVNTAGGYVCACPRHLRLHTDKHHCVRPSSYKRPYSYEELDSNDYLTASVDFPARYKNRN